MKAFLYVVIVLLPALIVGISNFTAFPDSWLAATLMLIVTVAVAGVFTWQSGNATPKIAHYCILADIAICVILSVNLGGHWLLAREVSAAKQGVEERHSEEDREDKRREASAERELKLMEAETKLQAEERRRLRLIPRSERRSAMSTPTPEPTKVPPVPLTAQAGAGKAPVPRLTPDEVRDKWWWFLTALAIAECAASVLAGAILAGIWEWDRNHDGIDDRLQRHVHNCVAPTAHMLADRQTVADLDSQFPDVLPTGRLIEGKGPRQ